MSDEQKFEALKQQIVRQHEELYGREARKQYGDSMVDAAQQAVQCMTTEQYQKWKELEKEIRRQLEAAGQAGISPYSETGRAITDLHRRWLSITGGSYTPEKHQGIAALYVNDPRFTAYYDRTVPGCARFLWEAVMYWAK